MLSRGKDDIEEVLYAPLHASLDQTERHSQLHTAAGLASCIDTLCAMQGEGEVEAGVGGYRNKSLLLPSRLLCAKAIAAMPCCRCLQ